MNIRIGISFLLWFLWAGALQAQSYTVNEVPDPKASGGGYVSDPAGLLANGGAAALNRMIASLERTSTAQIAVVVLPGIGDNVPKDFAVSLFEHWGIGQKGADNGLLILVVMDQRRTEIETGYGLEALLPDVICYRILLEELVPRFQQGDYTGGLTATVSRIKTLLESPEALAEMRRAVDPQQGWPKVMGYKVHPALYAYGFISILLGLAIMAWVVITLLNKEDLYDKYRHVRYVTWLGLIFVFPLPYIILYLGLRAVLQRLRNQPRYSSLNGQPMRKLNDQEEDEFLEAGQLTEEELGSVDYDVWVTDDRSDVQILRYARRLSRYKSCPRCNYLTYYHAHSQVLEHATYHSSGRKALHYECKNCHYQHQEIVVIPQKTRSSGGSGGSGGGGGGSWGGGSSGGGGAGASW